MMQRLFVNGEQGGYWPMDSAYLFEDSAGTIPATLNGVVGLRVNYVTGKPNAIQATTANKPYLRKTPVSNKFWLDSNTATGALTATFASSLGSACTIATVGAEGVTIADNQTVGTTYNLCPPYGYNGDVLIINRALTAVEKSLVTRVMGRNVPTMGSELVTNGGFETDSTWSKGSGWSISSGVASITSSPISVISQPITMGQKTYKLSYSINWSAGAIYPELTGGTGVWGVTRSASGYYIEIITTKNNTSFQFEAASGFTGTLDNVTFMEIL